MSFKSTVTKIREGLADFFNAAAMVLPENAVQTEMKKEGWAFGTVYSPMPRCSPIDWAMTPEGRGALGIGAAKADRQRFIETVAQKRQQLGLKPR
jgi:hypothetical protein